MRTGAGPSGLVKIASGALTALLVGAFASAAMAADGPGTTTPPAATSAASADGGTVSVATNGTAATSPDDPKPADAPPDFLHSIEVDGFVDGYYGWAFNKVGPQLRNFDIHHNNFSLNYVQQAYVSYLVPAGKGLTIDFGKFVTPAGAEVIENKDNFNYSRGLLFALAIPYYHAGVRAGYSFNDKVSLTGYLVNGWNDVRDNNKDKTVGASLTVKPSGKTTVIANYLVGNEQADDADGSGVRNLIDLVATYTATDKVSVLGNFDYGHDKIAGDGVDWYGVAFGLKFQ